MDGKNQTVDRRQKSTASSCARANTTFAGAHYEREIAIEKIRSEAGDREQAASIHVRGWMNIALAGAGTQGDRRRKSWYL